MKTLTIFKPAFFLLLASAATAAITNPVAAQGRHGRGNAPQRNESNNPGGGNGGFERRPATHINRNNGIAPNRGAIANRPVNNNINNRPRVVSPRTPGVANRPAGIASRPRFGTVARPAYRPVYGYNRPIYSASNPGWRYGYLPRRNAYYSYLPSTYVSINFGGFGYRYWNGVFYRPYNNLFSVVAPPVGIFINVLPVGYRTLYVRDYPYYYFNGTYYDKRNDNYYVVSPPVGAVVESLPAGYETVTIDGETYYTIDGAQYKPVVKDNGEVWYEVIKAN